MRYPLISTLLYNTPLLLDPGKAEIIERVFREHALSGHGAPLAESIQPAVPQTLAMAAGRFREKPYVVTEQGVAVLPVIGTMVHRGSTLDALSGMTSYTRLEALMDAVVADSDVRGVLLEVDSPGGQAAGVFDMAAKWRRQCAAAGKPMWAVANEMALSGGYVLACVAQRVVMTRTARVGSIGVIALHVDQSARDANEGLRYTAIHAGARKADGNPHEPLTDEARAGLQSMVDRLYGQFVAHVATMRGIAPEKLRAQEAGVFAAEVALAEGLADEVMSFNDALAAFSAHVERAARGGFGGKVRLQPQGAGMNNDDPKADGNLAAADVSAQLAAARLEGGQAMQARIRTILCDPESAGREAMAQHLAFDTAMAAEDAVALLKSAPKAAPAAAGNALADAMAKLTNPNVGADLAPADDGDGDAQAAASVWDRSNKKLALVRVK